jgi:hypothetical protein
VSKILQDGLGSCYKVPPSVASHAHHESSGHPSSILVKRHWFEQAWDEVISGPIKTEIHIGGAANFAPTGFRINRASIVCEVPQVLEQTSVLARG